MADTLHTHGAPAGARRRGRRATLNCCPACAATATTGRARRGPTPMLWLGLLVAGAALVWLAALGGEGNEPTTALAARNASAPIVGPLRQPPQGTAGARGEGRTLAEEPARTPAIEWRTSRAVGTPNRGRLEGGVLLPGLGVGFYTYDPATQQSPGGAERQWGTHTLVREILALGEWWARSFPNHARLGIGDLSRPEGGPFTGPGVGHASHQNGLDVDIRLPRRDGVEGPATPANYDRALTQALVDRLVAQGAVLVLIGHNLELRGPAEVVVRWPNHDDHLHVRFPGPG